MTAPTRRRKSGAPARAPAPPLRLAEALRWSRVRTAQARIAVGYYDRLDVKERVLEAVIKELSRR